MWTIKTTKTKQKDNDTAVGIQPTHSLKYNTNENTP